MDNNATNNQKSQAPIAPGGRTDGNPFVGKDKEENTIPRILSDEETAKILAENEKSDTPPAVPTSDRPKEGEDFTDIDLTQSTKSLIDSTNGDKNDKSDDKNLKKSNSNLNNSQQSPYKLEPQNAIKYPLNDQLDNMKKPNRLMRLFACCSGKSNEIDQ